MGVVLLDSNTIIGFLDADDALHPAADAAVRAAAEEHTFVVSVVTVAELLAGAKLGHHDEPMVRRFFAQVVRRRIPLDEPAAERAAELRAAQKGLKLPDALILATADLNADIVLTGDRRWLNMPGLTCELRAVAGNT
ncbi:MAG: PIN domain-containing protein [Acidimicrobiales bacterium]